MIPDDCDSAEATNGEKDFFAVMEYESNGSRQRKELRLKVPMTATLFQIRLVLVPMVRRMMREGSGKARYCVLTFRVDGSDKPLDFWEKVQDVWNRYTMRGKPVTSALFIPFWPRASSQGACASV